MTATIETLGEADRAAVHALLLAAGLPLDGFDAANVEALVAKADGRVVGSAALELYGPHALLRSVAVSESHRGQSLGTQLMQAVIALADRRGVTAVYLLTETAAAFFPKFGFVDVARAHIPVVVRESVEFTSACPATAQAFQLLLKRSFP